MLKKICLAIPHAATLNGGLRSTYHEASIVGSESRIVDFVIANEAKKTSADLEPSSRVAHKVDLCDVIMWRKSACALLRKSLAYRDPQKLAITELGGHSNPANLDRGPNEQERPLAASESSSKLCDRNFLFRLSHFSAAQA